MNEFILAELQKSYAHLGQLQSLEPIDAGLINQTYRAQFAAGPVIVQKISHIFGPAVHEDFQAVAHYLKSQGLLVPQIIPTADGHLTTTIDGQVFRAQTYIEGHSVNKITTPHMAFEAGRVLGQFHFALKDFSYAYHSKRRHAGDYRYHCDQLVAALNTHAHHDFFARVESLALPMLEAMAELLSHVSTTPRHAHGDPKISNILFDSDGHGLCLVDMDTLGHTGWSLELGDALRSWANLNQEDVLECEVDLPTVSEALRGYGEGIDGQFTAIEVGELMTHSQAITLCLSMRYAADALNESYFSFDNSRFSRAGEHNLQRATAMFNLYKDFAQKKAKIDQMARAILG
jgi:Ser/Thr protein kinase RdoA (MazF antagonist)